jgi:glycosyltransferase involved in cell wall biosynthesis
MRSLKYISWGDATGYAIAAKSYLRALIKAGINLTWTPMLTDKGDYETYDGTNWPCPVLTNVCNRDIYYDTVLIHTVPEYYPYWIDRERTLGRRVLGYTVWELEKLPNHWPEILNRLDAVLVPCEWNVEVFQKSGITVPIYVVPHLSQFEYIVPPSGLDRQSLRSRFGKIADLDDRFVFYNIAYWSNRKAPYLALEAYWRAFKSEEKTLMVLKTSPRDITQYHRHWRNGFRLRNPSTLQSIKALASRYSNRAPIVVITDESLSDQEMMALHEMGDCFTSLTRTEGWGLGAFEAARLGKPLVITGYGGQLDYLDPELAYLVNHKMVPVHEPTWSANYRTTDLWAEPSIDHAVNQMREIFENRHDAKKRASQQALKIESAFSTDAVVSTLLRALNAWEQA